MTDRTVTITSKNQITLPVQIVRSLNLSAGRRLVVRKKGNGLVLEPEQSIGEVLRKHREYAAKRMKRPVTDEELQNVARDAYKNQLKNKSEPYV